MNIIASHADSIASIVTCRGLNCWSSGGYREWQREHLHPDYAVAYRERARNLSPYFTNSWKGYARQSQFKVLSNVVSHVVSEHQKNGYSSQYR